MGVHRLRIIAGPNGSGKSSVFPRIQDKVRMGSYLNPDDLGLAFRERGVVESRERTGYTAALASGFIRQQLVANGHSFAFESVLSDPGKLKEITTAKEAGYRVYLYFVCTDNADINVARVANRSRLGGHSVPEIRIRERYKRTLGNLLPAFLLSDRAYIFDNSSERMALVLEANGREIHLLTEQVPAWVEDYLIIPLRSPSARFH
jgi:predicted ABC-type ATPase